MREVTNALVEITRDLVRVLDALEGGQELISNQGQAMDGYSALVNFREIARRAKILITDEPS